MLFQIQTMGVRKTQYLITSESIVRSFRPFLVPYLCLYDPNFWKTIQIFKYKHGSNPFFIYKLFRLFIVFRNRKQKVSFEYVILKLYSHKNCHRRTPYSNIRTYTIYVHCHEIIGKNYCRRHTVQTTSCYQGALPLWLQDKKVPLHHSFNGSVYCQWWRDPYTHTRVQGCKEWSIRRQRHHKRTS